MSTVWCPLSGVYCPVSTVRCPVSSRTSSSVVGRLSISCEPSSSVELDRSWLCVAQRRCGAAVRQPRVSPWRAVLWGGGLSPAGDTGWPASLGGGGGCRAEWLACLLCSVRLVDGSCLVVSVATDEVLRYEAAPLSWCCAGRVVPALCQLAWQGETPPDGCICRFCLALDVWLAFNKFSTALRAGSHHEQEVTVFHSMKAQHGFLSSVPLFKRVISRSRTFLEVFFLFRILNPFYHRLLLPVTKFQISS